MVSRIVFCMVSIMISTTLHAADLFKTQKLGKSIPTVFAHTKNEDAYWQALLYAASGKKEEAKTISAALNSGADLSSVMLPWKSGTITDIETLFDKLFIDSVLYAPQALSHMGLFESIGIYDHNAQLDDGSGAFFEQNLERAKENAALLATFAAQELSPEQKISYEIFSWHLIKYTLAGEPFIFHAYIENQLFGSIQDLVMIFTQLQPLETAHDVHRYRARLSQIARQLDQVITFMMMQESKGILLPQCALATMITMIKKLMPEDVTSNIFYAHVAQKMQTISMDGKDVVLEQIRSIIAHDVCPALHRIQSYLTQLHDRITTNHGVWALPDGDAFYAYVLQSHTSTDLSPAEIHALGLREVARIEQEMRHLFIDEGMNDPEKSVGQLMQDLAKDSRFYYPNTDEGRAACLAEYQHILERGRKELAHLFGMKPKTEVKIERVPAHQEDGMPMAYYERPSIDGSRPGIFYANLHDMTEVPTYTMETLAMHEAEPGHHFQIALQDAMHIPILRKLRECTAYCEGWALYTEKLAYEHGFYSSSFSKLGHLSYELMRAARLVVDTGLHYKRWTREQAIEYMAATTGLHPNSVISEVDRYLVMPGQACSYKIGQLKILELRARAKKMLGDKFDIRAFHDAVLGVGMVPLTVLESVVDAYIANA